MAAPLSTALADSWTGRGVTVGDIERELGALRAAQDGLGQRTSVMTHLAWVPPEWEEQARAALAGLGEQHPSRGILLLPKPKQPDGLDATVSVHCFAHGRGRHVCTELIELHLCGRRADAAASVVAPLLLPDLPVFLRWRGEPPFGDRAFEGLAALVDRLVVDSREWKGLPETYARLATLFDVVAVSDIVWVRALYWRAALAAAWPGIARVTELRVTGPTADALLLAGWLRSRLGRPVALAHEPAGALAAVAADCVEVEPPRDPEPSASDLLSDQLDRFGRDPVYEAATRAAA